LDGVSHGLTYLGRGRRSEAAFLLQNRDAFCDALITDMCRCARYKPSDVIGLTAAKRIAQMRPQASTQALQRPSSPHSEYRCHRPNFSATCTENRNLLFLKVL
jgi:xanthine dehydrogenase iron-sulfur cluster and FAD-binding subunit A